MLFCILQLEAAGLDASAQGNIAGNDPQALQEAKEILSNFLVNLQVLKDENVLYSGTYLTLTGTGKKDRDGEYAFVGFLATSGGKERFWRVKQERGQLTGQRLGECFDSLRLNANERWIAFQGGTPVEYDPNNHNAWRKPAPYCLKLLKLRTLKTTSTLNNVLPLLSISSDDGFGRQIAGAANFARAGFRKNSIAELLGIQAIVR